MDSPDISSTSPPLPRPPLAAAPAPRRAVTEPIAQPPPPQRSQSTESFLSRSERLVETLYNHPAVKIVAFSSSHRSSLTPFPSDNNGEPACLPASSPHERVIAVGPFRIYRARGSVAFLSCGSALQPILPKSQCWSLHEDNSTFILQIRRPQYWRIEMPVSESGEPERAFALRDVFDRILMFEKTECPFRRNFVVPLPEPPVTPVKKKAWTPEGKNLIASPFSAELPEPSPPPRPITKESKERTPPSKKSGSTTPIIKTEDRTDTGSDGELSEILRPVEQHDVFRPRTPSAQAQTALRHDNPALVQAPCESHGHEHGDVSDHVVEHAQGVQGENTAGAVSVAGPHITALEAATAESAEVEVADAETASMKTGNVEKEVRSGSVESENVNIEHEPESVQTEEHEPESVQTEDDELENAKTEDLEPVDVEPEDFEPSDVEASEVHPTDVKRPHVEMVGQPSDERKTPVVPVLAQEIEARAFPDCSEKTEQVTYLGTPSRESRTLEGEGAETPIATVPITDGSEEKTPVAPRRLVTPEPLPGTAFGLGISEELLETALSAQTLEERVGTVSSTTALPETTTEEVEVCPGQMPKEADAKETCAESSADASSTSFEALPPHRPSQTISDDKSEDSSDAEGTSSKAPSNLAQKRVSRLLAGRSFTAPPQLTLITSPPSKSREAQDARAALQPLQQVATNDESSPVGSTDSFHSVQSWHSPLTPLPPSPPSSQPHSPSLLFPHPHENIVLPPRPSRLGDSAQSAITPNTDATYVPSSAGATVHTSGTASPMQRTASSDESPSSAVYLRNIVGQSQTSALGEQPQARHRQPQRSRSNNLSISRRALSPLPPAANLFSPPATQRAPLPPAQGRLEAVRRLPRTIIHKTVGILLSPPSHLVALMLKVAARIAAGEWRGLVYGLGEGGEGIIPVQWDYYEDYDYEYEYDGEFSSWEDDEDYDAKIESIRRSKQKQQQDHAGDPPRAAKGSAGKGKEKDAAGAIMALPGSWHDDDDELEHAASNSHDGPSHTSPDEMASGSCGDHANLSWGVD